MNFIFKQEFMFITNWLEMCIKTTIWRILLYLVDFRVCPIFCTLLISNLFEQINLFVLFWTINQITTKKFVSLVFDFRFKFT